jgi:CHASE domain
LRARASGKGVLTAPFPLLKSNRLGVILTYAVYKSELPSNATPDERIEAAIGLVFTSSINEFLPDHVLEYALVVSVPMFLWVN